MMTPTDLTRRDLLRLTLAAGAASTLGLGAAAGEEFPKPAAPAPSASGYLDAALKAARWIHTARVETPQGVIWLDGPERPEGLESTPDLYTGCAGVVLFLLELARATGDKAYREEVTFGADALIAVLPEKLNPAQAQTGLYTGAA
ncbi:MAG: lanthionine synthetase LanC family protein, partial [Thermoanaerobaculia bacterium]